MAYPYSRSETVADGLVHAAGLLMAVPAFAYLISHSNAYIVSVSIYAFCAFISLVASAVFHMSPHTPSRPALHRIDHAAIYLKISGTYVPLVAVIGSLYAQSILALVSILAIFGVIAKLWFWRTDGKGSLALYLGMGWLSVLLIGPMWDGLPRAAFFFIMAGGLIYSAGTRVYAHPGMRYQNAIWHLIVLSASICFYAAILLSV